MVLQIANKIETWKTYQKRQARSQSGYLQGSQSPNQEHMVLRLRVLGLWNDTLHFPLPLVSLWPCSLPGLPLCTICPQCRPQAQLCRASMLSLRFHTQRYSCPEEPALVSLPQDNTSCPGGWGEGQNPCFLGPHSHAGSHCFCAVLAHKSTFMGHSNPATESQNPDRLLFIALFTIFSEAI